MPKRTILFVSNSLVVGGVERALISVLKFIPKDQFDITLMLFSCTGPLMAEIPEGVQIVEMPLHPLDRLQLMLGRVPALRCFFAHGHWLFAFRMLMQRLAWFLGGRKRDFNLIVTQSMMTRVKWDQPEYDFAFSYSSSYFVSFFVKMAVRARMKAIWCHDESQIARMHGFVYKSLYAGFDRRFGTHDFCAKANEVLGGDFFSVVPYFVDVETLRNLGRTEPVFPGTSSLKILTVGRICFQKGIDYAIEIARRLRDEKFDFRWYVVGGGEDPQPYLEQIRKAELEERFFLLGEKLNPFPYFAQCDIYAQPSRYEAYCLTVAEARTFNRPIIATDFVGAREQLKDGVTGLIVPVDDLDAFASGLKKLLVDARLRARLTENLSRESADQVEAAKDAWRRLLGI